MPYESMAEGVVARRLGLKYVGPENHCPENRCEVGEPSVLSTLEESNILNVPQYGHLDGLGCLKFRNQRSPSKRWPCPVAT